MEPLSILLANGLSSLQRNIAGITDWSKWEENDDSTVPLPTVPRTGEITPERTASFIAREMSSLSISDREKVYSDIHCVSDGMIETASMNEEKLCQMDLELNRLRSKEAYETALAMDRQYVMNSKFRLRFLRAELHDPRKAALRYARFFETKLELFGPTKLVKDIVQDDLDMGSMEAVYSGFSQFLPKRDRAGRTVSVNFPHPTSIDNLSRLRRSFYFIMVQSGDEETQRNGVVSLAYAVGQRPSQSMNYAYVWKFAQLNRCMPVRVEAVHFFHDSTLWATAFSFVKMSLGRFTRLRLRDHRVSSHQKCMDVLQSFGIPTEENFPVTSDGLLATKTHQETWERWRAKERVIASEEPIPQSVNWVDPLAVSSCSEGDNSSSQLRVGAPGPNDVLLGRGKSIYQHKGNLQFRELVESRRTEYDEAATFAHKQLITAEIVDSVKSRTGHFLLKDKISGWVEIDDHAARKKVAHTFRTMRGVRKGSDPLAVSSGSEGEGSRKRRGPVELGDDLGDSLGSSEKRARLEL